MTDTSPAPRPAAGSRARLVLGGGALAAGIVLAGSAAFAWQALSGGGTQPHDVLPSTVVAYARFDGDPSAAQKVKLLRLIRRSPSFAKEIGIKSGEQDLREAFAKELLSDCDVDYNKDIKPWIGDRFGVGVAKGGKTGFLAIQVGDEKAARTGIDLAADCLGFTDPGVVFTKGYALVGEGQDATEKAANEAEKSPLANKKTFIEDMEDLGDPGIGSVWVEAKGLEDAFASETGDAGTPQPLEGVRSLAAALRADDDSIEVTGVTHATKDIPNSTYPGFSGLPADVLAALSISGGADQVDERWTEFTTGYGGGIEGVLADFEEETGFVLPGDLETLLGDNLTIVAGDRNLSTLAEMDGPEDIQDLDVALAMHSDSDKAFALADKIARQTAELAGIELAVVKTKDGAVLATNETFAKGFTDGKPLADSESFRSVISDSEGSQGGFYFDIAKAIKAAHELDPPADVEDGLDQATILRALGLSFTRESDRVSRGTLRLSFTP